MKHALLGLLAILFPALVSAQTSPVAQAARKYRQQHERAIIDEFVTFLRIPNVAQDRANIQRNADFIVRMMEMRGVAARQVSVTGANPVVFGELRTPGAQRTIVFYAHYDGQPVDPGQWTTPPFTPTLRNRSIERGGEIIPLPQANASLDPESRLYARAAGDDKVPIMAMMSAIDAIRAASINAKSNVKFVFEGEEEAGSTNLERILQENKELFAGDLWFICDSPTHPSRRQLIAFGAPGALRMDLTVYGARVELHGGHYGNWAPNPALMLSRLLASMKDDQGHVLIKHFYDGVVPLSKAEKQAVAGAPDVDAQLLEEFGLGSRVGAPAKLAELITLPVLNIRGLASARVGAEATTVVPATATASLSLSIMKGMDYRRTVQQIQDHVRAEGYFVVEKEPSPDERQKHAKIALVAIRGGAYNGTRTPMELPISQEVIRVVESARGPAVKLPTVGGAVPMATIERILGTRTILMPIANHDDNQHSFDENVRIQNLWDGIELMAALITM